MSSRIRRRLAIGVLAGVLVLVVIVFGNQGEGYTVTADLTNATGLRSGANVRLDGAPVGRIQKITLEKSGLVHVKLSFDGEVVPLGKDARVILQADDLFGERYLQLTRGNPGNRLESGGRIPLKQTGVAVRLDDVVDSLNMSTRMALEAFLREQGASVVGRGKDLAATLTALPSSLQDTAMMLGQFGQDTQAIGRLIEESDRIVASVSQERPQLGRLVGSANSVLQRLASRRRQLGETVRTAPATLASAQGTLAELRAAARPLAPAADGLRATAPILTQTLKQIPPFSRQAIPTLQTAAAASPALSRLGGQGSPIVRRLKPLATELLSYSRDSGPALKVFDDATPGVFGLMEGWARSTQPIDGGGHLFRFGETAGTDLETAALARVPTASRSFARSPKAKSGAHARKPSAPAADKPANAPGAPLLNLPGAPVARGRTIGPNLPAQTAADALQRVLKQLAGGM